MPRLTPRQSQIRRNQEKFGSIFDEEDNEMEREGWKAILWVLPCIALLAYIITHLVIAIS
jgi:hypothetical protein